MGNQRSRSLSLSYDEASKRLSADESQRLDSAFQRIKSPVYDTISFHSFHHFVLSDTVPDNLAQQLYYAVGGSRRVDGKGLGHKDVVVLVALLTKSKLSERIEFLFHLFSEDGEWVVMLRVQERLREWQDEKLSTRLMSAIAETEKLNLEQFQAWIVRFKDEITVAKWLLDYPPILSSTEPSTTFYQTLSGVTHLEEKEILELEQQWWRIADMKLHKMDLERFKSLVSPPVPSQLVPGLFAAFDENDDAQIDFKELVCGLSACSSGPNVERQKFCFKVFDGDRDGFLTLEDVEVMIEHLQSVQQVCLSQETWSECEPKAAAKAVLAEYDLDQDGRLQLGDFLLWVNGKRAVEDFLQLLFEVSHIVLGLNPRNKHIEQTVIRNWMRREGQVELREGQLWYMVSNDWWAGWERWVQYPDTKQSLGTLTPLQSTPPGSPASSLSSSTSRLRGDSVVEWSEASDAVRIKEIDTAHLIAPKSDEESDRNHSPRPLNLPNSSQAGTSSNSSTTSDKGSPRRSLRNWSPCPRSIQTPTETPPLCPVKPGPVDNQSLLLKEKHSWLKLPTLTHEGGLLRDGLFVAGRDFQMVSESLWAALIRWYGAGNPTIPRKVILNPESKRMELELYPVTVTILRHQMGHSAGNGSYHGNPFTSALSMTAAAVSHAARDWTPTNQSPRRVPMNRLTFSKVARVSDLFEYLCRHFRLVPDTARLWLITPGDEESPGMLLEEEELSFMELGIKTGTQLLLEVRNKDLTWPEEMSSLVKNQTERTGGQAVEKGLTGLYNLGNTCFMNSALQCVSNTQPLTQYFNHNVHLYELNRNNVLGMKGNMAMAYASLVRDLWSGKFKFIAPLKFKNTIGKYAARFNDLNQHDCQELLSFLLDGLHEDLNRVHQKPYTELKDSGGRPDEVVAAEAWDNHLKRNQSIIVDLFHGLLKSEVRCHECGNCSVRFDPFTFLSLPLPLDNFSLVHVVVVKLDGQTPIKYGLRCPSEDSVVRLKERLGEMANLDPEEILLVQLSSNGAISRFFASDERVKRIVLNQMALYAFQLPGIGAMFEAEIKLVNGTVPNGKPYNKIHQRSGSGVSTSSTWSTKTGNSVSTDAWGSCAPSFGPSLGYSLGFHRKLEHQDPYFLANQRARPVIFGIPIVVPTRDRSGGVWCGADLYREIWNQVTRLVIPAAKIPQGGSVNHATDGDEAEREFPFLLSLIDKSGLRCAFCPWYKFCYGCQIPLSQSDMVNLEENCFIGVDWDLTAVHLRYQFTLEMASIEDPSVARSTEEHSQPVSLDSCLRAFTTPEELNDKDTYFCSKCRKHCSAEKKLSIWKLPPILIVHFKRFQYVANRWVKSCKMVNFPREGFDPRQYLPSPSVRAESPPIEAAVDMNDLKVEDIPPAEQGAAVVGDIGIEDRELLCPEKEAKSSPVRKLIARASITKETEGERNDSQRARTESSASVAPMMEPNDHRLKASVDQNDLQYDLYSIACHYGVLGAGHYVCYARRPNGEWFLFNDSRCKEIGPEEIDGNYAYLMFYERRGLDYSAYIPETVGDPVVESGGGEGEEGTEEDSKCSIQ